LVVVGECKEELRRRGRIRQVASRAGLGLLCRAGEPFEGRGGGGAGALETGGPTAGASHATSEARVEAMLLTSWDRGYAADGRQVWGSTAGAYRFVKQ